MSVDVKCMRHSFSTINFSILCLLLLFNEASFSRQIRNKYFWTLNDVTYLYPLPEHAHRIFLRSIENHVSNEILNDLPRLSVRHEKEVLNKMIYAVAIRIDPEFNQIRVVWQPITNGPQNKITTLDMALHSFYQLSTHEFRNLLQEIISWKQKYSIDTNSSSPLNIHPAFYQKSEKENSQVIIDLNELFFKYCRYDNTIKVTAMVLRGANDMWAFMGFDIDRLSQKRSPIVIPRTASSTAQRFVNQAVPALFFENAIISPLAFNYQEDSLENFVQKAIQMPQLTEDEVLKYLNISNRFENPHLHNTNSLDCVSCHIAQPAREWIFRNIHQNLTSRQDMAFIYQNAHHNLTNLSAEILNTSQIRGLGYFGRNIAISQRVIHESAEAADYLNYQNAKH